MEITVGIVGWTGTVLLLAAYGLLTARKLSASGWQYQTMNLVGGLALMVNTAYYSAWPSAALNLVWFGIGLVGLVTSRRVTTSISDAVPTPVSAAAPEPSPAHELRN